MRSGGSPDARRPGPAPGFSPPGYPGTSNDPLTLLTARTCELWPNLTEDLRELTGEDNQFQRCGGVELSVGRVADLQAYRDQWAAIGARTEWLEPQEIRELEPAFSGAEAGFLLPDRVRCGIPPSAGLAASLCTGRGCGLRRLPRDWVGFSRRANHGRSHASRRDCRGAVCGDCRSVVPPPLAQVGVTTEVVPVRGQIVQLAPSSIQITRVIEREKRYIVPRRDGRILIGATEEWAGYEKQNTDEAIAGLLEFGGHCSCSSDRHDQNTWAGLRPVRCGAVPSSGEFRGGRTGSWRQGISGRGCTCRPRLRNLCLSWFNSGTFWHRIPHLRFRSESKMLLGMHTEECWLMGINSCRLISDVKSKHEARVGHLFGWTVRRPVGGRGERIEPDCGYVRQVG